MTTKKATTNATVDPTVVTKEFEDMVATGRKSLQDAFISGTEAAEKAFKSNTESFKTNYEKAVAEGKTGFEKAIKSLEGSQFYDKNSAEAYVKASKRARKSVRHLLISEQSVCRKHSTSRKRLLKQMMSRRLSRSRPSMPRLPCRAMSLKWVSSML